MGDYKSERDKLFFIGMVGLEGFGNSYFTNTVDSRAIINHERSEKPDTASKEMFAYALATGDRSKLIPEDYQRT